MSVYKGAACPNFRMVTRRRTSEDRTYLGHRLSRVSWSGCPLQLHVATYVPRGTPHYTWRVHVELHMEALRGSDSVQVSNIVCGRPKPTHARCGYCSGLWRYSTITDRWNTINVGSVDLSAHSSIGRGQNAHDIVVHFQRR
jgi:hypothetical protein